MHRIEFCGVLYFKWKVCSVVANSESQQEITISEDFYSDCLLSLVCGRLKQIVFVEKMFIHHFGSYQQKSEIVYFIFVLISNFGKHIKNRIKIFINRIIVSYLVMKFISQV